jgi:hypothetical protein
VSPTNAEFVSDELDFPAAKRAIEELLKNVVHKSDYNEFVQAAQQKAAELAAKRLEQIKVSPSDVSLESRMTAVTFPEPTSTKTRQRRLNGATDFIRGVKKARRVPSESTSVVPRVYVSELRRTPTQGTTQKSHSLKQNKSISCCTL